jgi:allantoicase
MRAIEQIIGWQRWCGYPVFGRWVNLNTKTVHYGATADDLIVCLDENLPDGWEPERNDLKQWAVYNLGENSWHTANLVGWTATFFEALEAAVRHVKDEPRTP